MSTATALAPVSANANVRTIFDHLQSDNFKNQVALAVPGFCTPERLIRIALTFINRTPKLQECTVRSIASSLLVASEMGIEADGRHGHLIPRWNKHTGQTECTFMPDYKGLVGLLRKNGGVADVYADIICENDTIKIVKGLHRDLIHEPPHISKPRGPVIGAYAVIQYNDGGAPSFDVMSKEEIDLVRSRSQSATSGPWVTDYAEMSKKTVLKRLLKLADLNPDTAARVALDVDAQFEPIEQPRFASPAIEQPRNRRPMRLVKAQVAAPEPTPGDPAPAPEPAPTPPPAPPDDDPLPGVDPAPAPAPQQPPVDNAHVEKGAELFTAPKPPPAPAAPTPAPAKPAVHSAAEYHAAKIREAHPDYTEIQILKALVLFGLAEPTMNALTDMAPSKMDEAIADPGTISAALADLTYSQPAI